MKNKIDTLCQCPWFKNNRYKGGKGKNIAGRGLGCKERPGLGAENVKIFYFFVLFMIFILPLEYLYPYNGMHLLGI